MQLTNAGLDEQVRDALSNLYDPAALRAHPLTQALALDDDKLLPHRLQQGIEELRPGTDVKPNARAWRPYRVLHLRYVEGLNATEVQASLALSKSQYYREHEAAVNSLVALLSGGGAPAVSSPGLSPPRANPAGRVVLAGGGL